MSGKLKYLILFTLILCYSSIFAQTSESGSEDIKVRISGKRATIYSQLNSLSDQTGYMFIYDSKLFDNDKIVKVPSGEYLLSNAVKLITGDSRLETQLIGNHILISLPTVNEIPSDNKPDTPKDSDADNYAIVEGVIKDRIAGDPVAYATISLSQINLGTVSNQEGNFKLIIPDSLTKTTIKISHLGYVSREISVELLKDKKIIVQMDQKLIPLQEIIVRVVDPLRTIREAMQKRAGNYTLTPVNHVTFYREGVEYKDNISLTEAVFKIFKTGFMSTVSSEQVKLLKMRRFVNTDNQDTLVAKIKSSVYSSLLLDIIKNPPDFLSYETHNLYNYSHTDITSIDDRRVLVISFSQKEGITEPLYQGELYIDAESYAIVKASFKINPEFVNKTSDIFVLKRSRNVNITPKSIEYMVTYKPHNGVYYVQHIRGDLNFKVRRSGRIFSSDMHAWFEMVNCETITDNPTSIPRAERLPVRDILFETSYVYDKDFWGNFNTILQEEEITRIIKNYNFNK